MADYLLLAGHRLEEARKEREKKERKKKKKRIKKRKIIKILLKVVHVSIGDVRSADRYPC